MIKNFLWPQAGGNRLKMSNPHWANDHAKSAGGQKCHREPMDSSITLTSVAALHILNNISSKGRLVVSLSEDFECE